MIAYDEWDARLRACCGHYYSEPTRGRAKSDRFDLIGLHGMDVASIRCTIDTISRTAKGIRRDDAEHLFLFCMIEGEMGVRHNDRDELLGPGDFLLLDSTLPADLFYFGRACDFYSVHLPRNLFLAGRDGLPAVGRRVTRSHPLHAGLHNLIFGGQEVDQDEFLSEYLFDFVAMVFGPERRFPGLAHIGQHKGRMRYIREVMDRHLRDEAFSIDELADMVGQSRRQLQREMQKSGTSFTELLQSRRLRHLIAAKGRFDRLGQPVAMSHLAHYSGFGDQSHFNHVFRQHFDMAPKDYFAGAWLEPRVH